MINVHLQVIEVGRETLEAGSLGYTSETGVLPLRERISQVTEMGLNTKRRRSVRVGGSFPGSPSYPHGQRILRVRTH